MLQNLSFKDFEDFFDGASRCYHKDDNDLLFLSSNDKNIKCIIVLDKDKTLSEQLEQLAVNIQAHPQQTIASNKCKYFSFKGEDIPVIAFNDVEFDNGVSKEKILPISEISSRIQQNDMDGYVANAVYRNTINTQLSPEQFEILKYYKAEGYEFINSFMGNRELKTRGNEKITPEFCDKLLLLDKAFKQNKPLDDDLVVYRGTKHEETEHFSFISTSLSRKVATENFSPQNVYEIHLPKGTHVLSLDNIEGLRDDVSQAEAEILLPPSAFINQSKNENDFKVNIQEHDFPDLLLNALERRKDEFLKGKSPDDVQQYMNSIAHVRNIVENTRNKSSSKTDDLLSDEAKSRYTELVSAPNSSAEDLWNTAKQLETKYPTDNYYGKMKMYAVADVVSRDPKFQPEEMLRVINNATASGYDEKVLGDEISMHAANARAVGEIVAHNPRLSTQARQTLRQMTRECISFNSESMTTDNSDALRENKFLANNIISAYGKCDYDSPQQAKDALTDIKKLSTALYNNPYLSDDKIKSVHSIVNSGIDGNKEVATVAFQALQETQTVSPDLAKKMISIYSTISYDNPDLAEASLTKINKIFKDFSSNEQVQKACLDAVKNMNGSRSHFDEETQKKIDNYSKLWDNRIKSETIKRMQGKETEWKSQNTGNTVNNNSKSSTIEIHRQRNPSCYS